MTHTDAYGTTTLRKSLTVFSGTLFFLNIVIGVGLLVLPGLIYQQIGSRSTGAWLVCSASVFPLLVVFILLGRYFPHAGGLTHYAHQAFGRIGQNGAVALFLGAVLIGLPGIALTGGFYLSLLLPPHPHLYAFILIAGVTILHLIPGNALTRVVEIIGTFLLFAILVLIMLGYSSIYFFPTPPFSQPVMNTEEGFYLSFLKPYMTIFFAFTGWEIGSTSTEEFKNPSRDFPKAMLISYGVAVILYYSLALLISFAHIRKHFSTPFSEILYPMLGHYGQVFITILATLLITANLFGGIWAISRLIYSLGRSRTFPSIFGKTTKGIPHPALIFTGLATTVILFTDSLFNIGLGNLLGLAGQNLLLLYGVAAASLILLGEYFWQKCLGSGVVFMVIMLTILAGKSLYYPAGLLFGAILLSCLPYPHKHHSNKR